MNHTDPNYPDLEKYAAELASLEDKAPAPIEIHPLAAIAIISHIQLATRHPSLAGREGLTSIAIGAARQLQELFNPESTTAKVLELGWKSEEDLPPEWLEQATDGDGYVNLDQIQYFPDAELFEDRPESFEDYIGEEPLDRFVDPEEERATYEPEPYWHP
ncbi:hypothetical protein QUA42_02620 [Microcoleus sp. Pol11C2]|uniref:hypothetical protein n=1 Tax=Microcoleus sp. Pol11C2 TaxID=3055389 RepID=UPI002FD1A47E